MSRAVFDSLLNIINEILSEKGNKPIDALSEEMSLRNDIGFDSLDLAKLTVLVEEEYDTDIFEEGVVDSIQEITDIINRNR